jgi:hypothetical protein
MRSQSGSEFGMTTNYIRPTDDVPGEILLRIVSALFSFYIPYALMLRFRHGYSSVFSREILFSLLAFWDSPKSWFCSILAVACYFVFVKYPIPWYMLIFCRSSP